VSAARFQVGDRVVSGYGRYRMYATVDEVVNANYVVLRWDDGVESYVYNDDVRKLSDDSSN